MPNIKGHFVQKLLSADSHTVTHTTDRLLNLDHYNNLVNNAAYQSVFAVVVK